MEREGILEGGTSVTCKVNGGMERETERRKRTGGGT